MDIDLIGLLCRTEIFQALPPEQIKAIARVVEFREYPAAKKIVKQGEPGEEFYIIASGAAQVLVEDERLSTQQVILTLQAGQSFGETALLTDEKRSATVQTTGPTICAVLSRVDFQKVLAGVPGIALAVCKYLAARLAVQCKLTGFRFLSAEQLRYDARAYQLFPESLLRRCEAIPLGINGRTLTVAMTRPNDPHSLQLLRQEIPGMGLEPVGCTREDYEAFIRQHRVGAGQTTESQLFESGKISLRYASGDRLCLPLRALLEAALTRGLDFIVVEMGETRTEALAEVAGRLEELVSTAELEQLPELRLELDRLLDGSGCAETLLLANGHRVLMSLSALRSHEKARYSLQLSDGNRPTPPLDQLVLSGPLLQRLKDTVGQTNGLVLLEGAQASGLSTTLRSILQHQAQHRGTGRLLLFEQGKRDSGEEFSSWPLTSPIVELLEVGRRQRAALIAFDGVGRSRLAELLSGPTAAPLVVATYQDPAGLFETLSEFSQSGGVNLRPLKLVLRQKLAFRLCDGCRQPVALSSTELKLLKESRLDNRQSQYFRAAGCEQCHDSGIAGKIPIFEVIRVDDQVRAGLLSGDSTLDKALRDGTAQNSFQDYTRALIAQGTIDPTEGLRLFPPVSASFSLSS